MGDWHSRPGGAFYSGGLERVRGRENSGNSGAGEFTDGGRGTGLYIDALIYDYKFGEHEKNSQCDRAEMCSQFLTIGIKTDPEVLRERITERADKLFVQELFEETRNLVERYGWGSQAMKSNIYQFAWGYLQGEYSLEKAKELFIYDDWHLAKRQMTWFKRNKNIIWLPLEEIRGFVLKCIQDEQRK